MIFLIFSKQDEYVAFQMYISTYLPIYLTFTDTYIKIYTDMEIQSFDRGGSWWKVLKLPLSLAIELGILITKIQPEV